MDPSAMGASRLTLVQKLQREIANARGVPNDRPLKWPSPPRKLTGEDVGGEVEKTSSSPGNSGPGDTPAKAGKRKYRRHPKVCMHGPTQSFHDLHESLVWTTGVDFS